MEQRISLVTLGVDDLDRARDFYESLGWQPKAKGAEGVVFFQAGPMVLSLYPRGALAEDVGVSAGRAGFSGVALAQNARSRDGVDAVMAEAEAAGARVLKPAADTFWGGYAGYFADPDGHIWEVAWNPHFPMDDKGAITLPD